MNTPKVFISYSHDSFDHKDRVLKLSNQLRADGIDCMLDQYEISPPEGWPRWTEQQIEKADFVLIICTENYNHRRKGEEKPGIGNGVYWEATIIDQLIYGAKQNKKVIPILFTSSQKKYIPLPIKGANQFQINTREGYEALHRYLTNQPLVIKPDLGIVRRENWRNEHIKKLKKRTENEFISCRKLYKEKTGYLSSLALEYYKHKGLINLWKRGDTAIDFPLIYKDNWLSQKPIDIDQINIFWNETNNNTIYPFSFKILPKEIPFPDYIKTVDPQVELYNNFAYKLDKIESNDSFSLTFSLCRYYDYINTCEVLPHEFCWIFSKKYKNLFSDLNFSKLKINFSKISFPTRDKIIDVFDFNNRGTIAGVNTLLIKINKKGENLFYIHRRIKDTTAEAMNTIHVVPAGTFQPENDDDNLHALHFSLKRNIFRKFAEELLGEDIFAKVRRNEKDSFKESKKLRQYVSIFKNLKGKIYFWGVGLDPLTTKPEILTCMVIDGSELSKLSGIELEYIDNFQGMHDIVPFTKERLNYYIKNEHTLPAGKACLLLAEKHYDYLINSFK